MTQNGCKEALVSLGFNGLEAGIYAFLLQESPVTGYRVAQALGKPVANTYKAVESLANKGAVIVDDGSNRLCRAVPPDELLGQMERDFQARRARAAAALAQSYHDAGDDRVYQLRSVEQVMERCRAMLDRCTHITLLDISPGTLANLRSDIERTATRGIDVALKVYEPADVAGAQVTVDPDGRRTLKRRPGQWVNLVIDGSEHLLAFLDQEGQRLHQAIWSGSVFLSWMYHGAISKELLATALERGLKDGAGLKELRSILTRYGRLGVCDAPGYKTLMRRFGDVRRRRAKRARGK